MFNFLTPSVALVIIDAERSFVDKSGSLPVPGAEASMHRAALFIDKNRKFINKMYISFDWHKATKKHIFYPEWWINAQGKHPNNYQEITAADVLAGKWFPLFEVEWSIRYVQKLGSLTIWPEHCTENTKGSELYPPLKTAVDVYSLANHTRPVIIKKGQPERTEFYGMFGAEVEDPNDPRTKLNVALMREISAYSLTYWLGEEAGHCVKRSLEQYIAWCLLHEPSAISKMRYVSDCIDRLDIGPDYDKAIDNSIADMVQQGMQVVKSTDRIF